MINRGSTAAALAVAAATALSAALAFAHGGATGVVKQRMEAMEEMGKANKTLSDMFRGSRPYDADIVRAAAATFASHAGENLVRLFPEGSLHAPSEARPEIWEDWDAFRALADRLAALSEGLAAAAANDSSAMPGNGGGMMGSGGGGMMGSGGRGMMGSDGGSMMGGAMPVPPREALAAMPAEGVFHMVVQTCSSCHTRFRVEKQ